MRKSSGSKRQTLLNYTTTVDATKTIAEIQNILVTKGAQSVQVDYEKGFPSAVTFKILIDGIPLWYRLPSKYDEAFQALKLSDDVPQRYRTRDQAIRVCWRILKDWVQAQMAIVQLGQAQMGEAFFSYAIDAATGKTLFEHWRENRKQLGEGSNVVEGRFLTAR